MGRRCLRLTRAVWLAACLLPLWLAGSAAAQAPAASPRAPAAAPRAPVATPRATAATPRAPAAPARAAQRPVQTGGTIEAIKVEGNQRIETGTIRSYMLV